MTGKVAFEVWGNIDPKFILEAAPDAVGASLGATTDDAPEKAPKGHRSLGGWVAAAACAIVALGVYLGAMWLGQGPWEPPAVTVEGTEETVVTAPDETTDETTPPDETPQAFRPFLTPDYVVEKIDGQCYLNFYKGNRTTSIDHITYVVFENVEDMFTSIVKGDFTQTELLEINGFNSLSSKGYRVVDIWDLATPVLPEGCEMGDVWWEGDRYHVYFSHLSYPYSSFMDISRTQKTTGWAEDLMDENRLVEDAVELTFDGIPAVLVNADMANRKILHLSLTDEATGREIYVSAEYPPPGYYVNDLEAMVAEVSPTKIQILGTQGNKEYSITLYNYIDIESDLPKLTKDLILSFGLEAFEPPEVEMSEINTTDSYEVESIDGTYYLTIPDYDFTILDTYLPKNLTYLNSPYFNTLSDMYDAFKGEKSTLTLTEIIQYRLMMDENGRVRLPDLDRLLTPVIPDTLGKMTRFTFYETGNYSCRVWDRADGITIYFSGGITATGWQEGYNSEFDSFYGQGEADPGDATVVQGLFDGLPCTFYEYSNGSGTWALCHVTRVEGDHRQDMFVYFYDSVLVLFEGADPHFILDDLDCYEGCYMRILGIRDGLHYSYSFGGFGISLDANCFAMPSEKLLDQLSAAPYHP